MADILFKKYRIINAVHDTVPQELWSEILRKIDGPLAGETPMAEFEDRDGGEHMYGPIDMRKRTKAAMLRPWEHSRQWMAGASPLPQPRPQPPLREFRPATVRGDDDF